MTGKLPWYRTMVGGPDIASCLQVGRQLQAYLDEQLDDLTAARLRRHLALCRRCGMKAETYRQIKDALTRRRSDLDPEALARLRTFGQQLVDGTDDIHT